MSAYLIMLACLVYLGPSADGSYNADVAVAVCLWGLAVLIALAAVRSIVGLVKNSPEVKP